MKTWKMVWTFLYKANILVQDIEASRWIWKTFFIHGWKIDDKYFAFYTEKKLGTLHPTSGHPTVMNWKWFCVMQMVSIQYENCLVSRENFGGCRICAELASTPRRFKLTVGSEELRLNHRVQSDTMFLNGSTFIHMVDEATHFYTASFLCIQ